MNPPRTYRVRFSRERQKRGLPAWGVFEIVSDDFARGISQHHSEQEAEDERRRLEREASLAHLREVGKAEGLSERMIEESEASMRSAYMVGDMFRNIFGGGQ